MDRFRCIEVFIEVARRRSFSGAAERLGMAKGNVTKYVAWLEQTLGAQLLVRTTKSVSLTEAGLSLLENGQALLDQMGQAQAAVSASVTAPTGLLRIGVPARFGAVCMMPAVAAFSELHPEIRVVLYLDDGGLDVVAEGLDLTIRVSVSLKDSSLVAQKLLSVPQSPVASERYLSLRGTPRTPEDLTHHNCLVNGLRSSANIWSFEAADGRRFSIPVSGIYRANFGEALRNAAIWGEGIAKHTIYSVAQDIHEGRLKRLLTDYTMPPVDIYAVYHSRNLPAKVRTFIEFLKARLKTMPDWATIEGPGELLLFR